MEVEAFAGGVGCLVVSVSKNGSNLRNPSYLLLIAHRMDKPLVEVEYEIVDLEVVHPEDEVQPEIDQLTHTLTLGKDCEGENQLPA